MTFGFFLVSGAAHFEGESDAHGGRDFGGANDGEKAGPRHVGQQDEWTCVRVYSSLRGNDGMLCPRGCKLQLAERVLKEKTWGVEAHDVASLLLAFRNYRVLPLDSLLV